MNSATGQNNELVDNLRINGQKKELDLEYFLFMAPSLSFPLYASPLSLYRLQHECDLLSETEQTRD